MDVKAKKIINKEHRLVDKTLTHKNILRGAKFDLIFSFSIYYSPIF